MNKITRRNTLLGTLLGAGAVGLRSLATGIPASILLDPRKALANPPSCPTAPTTSAQFVIFNTSGGGDPIGCNAPGTYISPPNGAPPIVHASLPTASVSLGGQQYTAAAGWSTLASTTVSGAPLGQRMQFWHIMTNTPVHPKEPNVLELMGLSPQNEMLPSLLAKALAPALNTIQSQPVALGTEALSYNGQTLPIIPPSALKDTLANPGGALTNLQSVRDQTLNQVYALYKNTGATATQQAFVDQFVTSQSQLRCLQIALQQDAINLASLQDDANSQVIAAVALIRMNIAPVISVHIPFGADNHNDPNLATEASETTAGFATLQTLLSQLTAANLQDKVTFMSLNVFGRTLAINSGPLDPASNGRNHNPNLQTSLVFGKPFVGGVIGGITNVGSDYGCTNISSTSGAGGSSGDIKAADTLGAFAQTMLAGVGGDPTAPTGIATTGGPSYTGKVISSVLH